MRVGDTPEAVARPMLRGGVMGMTVIRSVLRGLRSLRGAQAQPPIRARVLFVCMGNMCRSPTAEAVFRKRLAVAGLSQRIECDSAGTHDVQLGIAPDGRAKATALRRGYDVSRRGGRQIDDADFDRFDLILAMDRHNLSSLRQRAPSQHHAKIRLLLEFAARRTESEVPDPYYGTLRAFDLVLDMIEDACDGLLEYLIREYSLQPTQDKGDAY